MAEVTAADVARRIDVPPATLPRWVRSGLVPLSGGAWTGAAIAQARQLADAETKLFIHEPQGFSEPTERFVAERSDAGDER